MDYIVVALIRTIHLHETFNEYVQNIFLMKYPFILFNPYRANHNKSRLLF